MNKAKLGVYVAPTHDPRKWKEYIAQVQPPLVRILMPGPYSVQTVSDVFVLAPDAKISLRWWDVDDGGEGQKQAKLATVEDARKRARADYDVYLNRYVRMNVEAHNKGLPFPQTHQVLFNAINEPPVDEGKWEAVVAYNKEFVQYAESEAGPNVMVAEFGVGHPSTWPPDWSFFQPVIDVFDQGDVLALHEYWQPEGPFNGEDWGALAGRYTKCPFKVPIAITECGVDGRIYNKHQPPDTGWQKFMNAEHYTGQLGSYLGQLVKDARVIACTPFETDFANKEWASFDTLPILPYVVKVLEAFGEQQGVPNSDAGSPVPEPGDASPPVEQVPVGNPSASGALDPRVLMSVLKVESGGEDDLRDGLKIRFEPRVFKQYVTNAIWDKHFKVTPGNYFDGWYRVNEADTWLPIHTSQASENAALRYAMTINQEGALESTSMGMGQIMGFNAKRVGFPNALAMFDAMSRDQAYHLIAFFNYMLSDPDLVKAVRQHDWDSIARLYNGSGNVAMYSKRLQEVYNGGS